jgi:ribonuclease PH
LSFANCHTNSASCSVASIQAFGLPWPALLVKVSSSNYLMIKGIQIDLLYSGDECALADIPVEVMGSAGGLIDNLTESAIFNSSSFSATATKLLALGSTVQLQGTFELQATGSHSGQSLAVL